MLTMTRTYLLIIALSISVCAFGKTLKSLMGRFLLLCIREPCRYTPEPLMHRRRGTHMQSRNCTSILNV